jgi:eukaryotic-like serine/threonine-protein kinase
MSLPRLRRLEVGALIGSHRLERLIGRGATASVFEALHTALGTRCAIKVLHPEHVLNAPLVRRFFGEGRAIVQVGHPNVVEVSDVGVTPEGHAWMRMELLDGTPLSRALARHGPLPVARACHIAGQVARALAAAHAVGVVHRDLKPDHVFLCRRHGQDDFVKVLDFGIAKRLGLLGDDRTETGVVLGTARYMSPEQCNGERDVDHRTDMYALGLLLHLMIAGELPFDGDGPGHRVVQHLTVAPRPLSATLPHVPAALEALVLRALAKDPGQRWPRMDDFGDALVPFGGPARASGEPPREVGRVHDAAPAVPTATGPLDGAASLGEPTGEATAPSGERGQRRQAAAIPRTFHLRRRTWLALAAAAVITIATGAGVGLWAQSARQSVPAPVPVVTAPAPPSPRSRSA